MNSAARLASLTLILGVMAAHAEEDSMPLPRWSLEEIRAMRANPAQPPLLGELLGTGEDLPEVPPSSTETGLVGDSPEKVQPSADLSRFLPLSLFKSLTRPRSLPAPTQPPLGDVPPEFLRECEESSPNVHLIDPNHELSETAVEDFERFLVFHANDARIPLKLLIIGRNQQLPAGVNLAEVAGGSVAQGQSALVVCPYGAVGRARLFVSRAIQEAVPPDDLNGLLEDCIRDARRATDPDEQLHRLLVRLSVRLFWMQRVLAPVPAPILASSPVVPPSQRPILAEVAAAAPATPSISPPARQSWLPRSCTGPGAGGLALLAFAAYAAWRWRRYKLRHYQWLLPAPEKAMPPRFGGSACGGGVSIRYR